MTSLQEVGGEGRTALAWQWALTGARASPVTLCLPPGRTPSREEILAEADAEPEGSTAPPGVPTSATNSAKHAASWPGLPAPQTRYLSMTTTAAGSSAPATTTPAPTTPSAKSAATRSAACTPLTFRTPWTPMTLSVHGSGPPAG